MSLPPEPPTWPPPSAPPPRRVRPAVVAAIAAAAVVGVGSTTFLFVNLLPNDRAADPAVTVSPTPSSSRTTGGASPTAAPAPATPIPIPTATATSTPDPAPTTPAGPDRSLKKNTLYSIDLGKVSTRCDITVRRPKPPLANKKLAPYLRDLAGCLTKVFTKPLGAKGFTLSEPKVKTYHKTVKTPCGKVGQSGPPAFYCGTTRTIYFADTRDDSNESYTFARLGYVGLMAHEFGHHIQATTGILTDYSYLYADASRTGRYALSRRLELQAQCFEGVFLQVTRKSTKLRSYDRVELRTLHSYTGDEDPPKGRKPDHGTSKEQYRWLERGLDDADFGRCNTWTASKKLV